MSVFIVDRSCPSYSWTPPVHHSTSRIKAYLRSLSHDPERVYPQSNGNLALVDIDALKGFVDLWVYFFVAKEDIY